MPLSIDLAVAKTNKYASRESGDTAEVVERPGGGFSLVVADGQGSGRAAKTLSQLVAGKAVTLLKDGVRDGAAARAVHDHLFAFRHGQVSATLEIVSVDLHSGSLVVARNASTPLVVAQGERWSETAATGGPIGRYHLSRPDVHRFPLKSGMAAIVATDGVFGAGARGGRGGFDLCRFAGGLPPELGAAPLADAILGEAIRRDDGKPGDDMTVAVVRLGDHGDGLLIRRLTVRVPLP